jgi:hypothetical protein
LLPSRAQFFRHPVHELLLHTFDESLVSHGRFFVVDGSSWRIGRLHLRLQPSVIEEGLVFGAAHVIYVPDLDAADRLAASLGRICNIASDGLPILGLDSRDLLEIACVRAGLLSRSGAHLDAVVRRARLVVRLLLRTFK